MNEIVACSLMNQLLLVSLSMLFLLSCGLKLLIQNMYFKVLEFLNRNFKKKLSILGAAVDSEERRTVPKCKVDRGAWSPDRCWKSGQARTHPLRRPTKLKFLKKTDFFTLFHQAKRHRHGKNISKDIRNCDFLHYNDRTKVEKLWGCQTTRRSWVGEVTFLGAHHAMWMCGDPKLSEKS